MDRQIFNDDDIVQAIKACDLTKGIGTDACYGEILLDKNIRANFVDQIKGMLNQAKFPQYLSKGRLILLPKLDSCFPEINETRPISIESVITKIMEKAILTKLKESNSILTCLRGY